MSNDYEIHELSFKCMHPVGKRLPGSGYCHIHCRDCGEYLGVIISEERAEMYRQSLRDHVKWKEYAQMGTKVEGE